MSVENTGSGPRIALFTHDTFGLGHVRRCLHFLRGLSERAPDGSCLLVTGSPALHALGTLPPNADYVKIPTIAKTGSKKDQPSHLPLPLAETTLLRSGIIRETILSFGPDVFLVDNFPLGSRDELLPTLKALKETGTRVVLGLRDVLGAPEVVRKDWTRQGMYEVLNRYYDRILVYGAPEIFDVIEAYDLPPALAAKVSYCGYVTELPAESNGSPELYRELGFDAPFLLATGGGGGDAYPLLSAFVQALDFLPETPSLIVAGPLMSPPLRAKLEDRVAGRDHVKLVPHTPDLRRYMGPAAAVVSMCGYNTAAELVANGATSVVVPRTWRYGEHLNRKNAGTEWEQLLRAKALADKGWVRLVEPESLTPEVLAEEIRQALSEPKDPGGVALNLDGRGTVVRHLLDLTDATNGGGHVSV